ncbi:DNA repair protein RecO [Spiroplasma endosymbiont of Anurida maritima]|uniref:DNA repair protein RecO n=1 Tax=Spiroplasma endosymbiont of Anurida maritima TaxID=2967972 RepID=UPI0036D2A287
MAKFLSGIIIKTQDYNNFDKILTVFSKEHGKIGVYALGVKKPTSKNKFSTQFLDYSDFEIFLSSMPDKLSKLKTGNLIKRFDNLKNVYNDYLLATLICEITDQATENKVPNLRIFNYLLEILDNLNNEVDNIHFIIFFLLKMLTFYGSNFNFQQCVVCKTTSKIKTFSFINEGLVCVNCLDEKDYFYSANFLKYLIENERKETFKDIAFEKLFMKEYKLFFTSLTNYYINKIGIFSYAIFELKKNKMYYI